MDDFKFDLYWQDIPEGKNNAVTYAELVSSWHTDERRVRKILQALSTYDNGDNFVLIRSARTKGFYKTDDIDEIRTYKKECIEKARSMFKHIKKINRILDTNTGQFELQNNMRIIRELKGLKQAEVCQKLKQYEKAIDKSMLSKMENNVCLPTPKQLALIAEIYDCDPAELIEKDLFL